MTIQKFNRRVKALCEDSPGLNPEQAKRSVFKIELRGFYLAATGHDEAAEPMALRVAQFWPDYYRVREAVKVLLLWHASMVEVRYAEAHPEKMHEVAEYFDHVFPFIHQHFGGDQLRVMRPRIERFKQFMEKSPSLPIGSDFDAIMQFTN